MPVVTFVRDMDTNVVQHRCIFEPVTLAVAEAVKLAGLVEERQGQPGHLARVVG